MAEFLVRIRDKVGHNAKLLGEREVVSACTDGWPWSDKERTNPDWRILKAPGMSLAEAETFTVPEPVDETLYVRRRRAFKIDYTLLPANVVTWLNDDTRSRVTMDIDPLVLSASKQVRVPLPKTDVIAPLAVIAKTTKKVVK
jgi:hypothetical protein